MRGITNAPQGGGSSGGTWTKRADNNDWSDLFSVSGSNITSLKDIIFFIDPNVWTDRGGYTYVPKGVTHTMIPLNISRIKTSSTTPIRLQTALNAYIDSSHITGNNLRMTSRDIAVDVNFNNQTVSYSIGSSGVVSFSKDSFTIFTKD